MPLTISEKSGILGETHFLKNNFYEDRKMKHILPFIVIIALIFTAGIPPSFTEEPPPDLPPPLESPLETLDVTWGMSLEEIRAQHLTAIVKENKKTEDTRAMLLVNGTTTLVERSLPSRFGLSFDTDNQLVQITTVFNTWMLTMEQHVVFFTTVYGALKNAYGDPDEEGKAWIKNEPKPEMDPFLAIFSGILGLYAEWVLEDTLVTVTFKGNGQMFYVVIFYEDLSKNPDRMSDLYPQLPTEVLKL
jgi:hypothetical protein